MGGQDVSASQGPRKMTADTGKWIRENLLLMVTLSGVILGAALGKYNFISFIYYYYSIFSSVSKKYLAAIMVKSINND